MKGKLFSRQEKRFLLAALAVTAVCIGLAFWFAVPLCAGPGSVASEPVPLVQSARVDLNTAGLDALCTLPEVGQAKAQAILDSRAQDGPFERVDDAVRVPGITRRIVDSWGNLAYVS